MRIIVSLSTKSKTLLLYSAGNDTQTFWFNLSNMVEVETSAFALSSFDVIWALAQLGFIKNKAPAKIGANLENFDFLLLVLLLEFLRFSMINNMKN